MVVFLALPAHKIDMLTFLYLAPGYVVVFLYLAQLKQIL